MAEDTERLLEAIHISDIDVKADGIDIENETKEIFELVLASKQGDFQRVFDILGTPDYPKKSHLINVIPESRRWGILHQAVYWNNLDIVKTLLKFETCDCNIPTKYCTFDNGDVGVKNPEEIAEMYGYVEVKELLASSHNGLGNQDLPTFQPCGDCLNGTSLFAITLAAYKKAFHPGKICKSLPMFEIMGNIYTDITRSQERMKAAQRVVCEALEGVCSYTFDKLKKVSNSDEFFRELIGVYTEEKNSVLYSILTSTMRRQKGTDYRPTAEDLAIGPYILMYQITLLFWPRLKQEHRTTYRKMLMTDDDLKQYTTGTEFKWVSFVSTSASEDKIQAFPSVCTTGDNVIVFTIENNIQSAWKPRNITKYSQYVEDERTYPAGAQFRITAREAKADAIYIDLKLLDET